MDSTSIFHSCICQHSPLLRPHLNSFSPFSPLVLSIDLRRTEDTPCGLPQRPSRWSRFADGGSQKFMLCYRLQQRTAPIPPDLHQPPPTATPSPPHSRSDLQLKIPTGNLSKLLLEFRNFSIDADNHAAALQTPHRLALRRFKPFYYSSLSAFGASRRYCMKHCHCKAIWRF